MNVVDQLLGFGHTKTMSDSMTKRGPGRPPTGRDPVVTTRLPADLINRVELWCGQYGTTRSAAIRCLVELGLHAPEKKAARLAEKARSRSPR